MAYEIEKVNEGNVDTPLTNFPVGVDYLPRMSDVSAATLPLVIQYGNYYNSGNFTAANQLRKENPDLEYCLFTADGYNKFRDALIAMEYYLLNQVDTLYNQISQNATGINDNPTPEQASIVTYSADKIESVVQEAKDEVTKVRYENLPVTKWEGAGPFIQTLTLEDITENDEPLIGITLSNVSTESVKKQIQKSWNFVDDIDTADGYIVFTCKFKKPIIDIPLVIKGV